MCRIIVKKITSPCIVGGSEELAEVHVGQKRQHEEVQEEHEDESNANLRAGKWTPEEEKYADALIEKFEAGSLLDCPSGRTLRAYLSQKLNCIPMRVSKKYAGQCIGKQTYVQLVDHESIEETERIQKLATTCWDSIDKRLKNRRKRRNKSADSPSESGCALKHEDLLCLDNYSDKTDSLQLSDHTDGEDLSWEDIFFQTSLDVPAEFDDLLVSDDMFADYFSDLPVAHLSDEALLL